MKFNENNINHQPLNEYLGKNYIPTLGERFEKNIIDSTTTGLASKISVSGINAYYTDDFASFVEYPETRIHFTNDGINLVILTDVEKVPFYVNSHIDDAGELIIEINR